MLKKMTVMTADIDGTLCIKGEIPGPRTIAAIERLHKEGVLFGPASGRPMDRRILRLAQTWGLSFDFDFAIGMNGGDLYDKETDTTEHYYQLTGEQVKKILTPIAHLDMNAIVYINGYDEIHAMRMDAFMQDSINRNHSHVEIGDVDFLGQHPTGKVEIHLKPNSLDEFMRIVNENADPSWICIKTFQIQDHVTMEFIDPRVNKGVALKKYAENHNIPLEEIIAFGDMENDIGLIKEAGWGVCLINGADDTKAVAQAITEYPCLEDGVGRYLEDHWFNR
ncbi:MAG: HAD-IIB family hydrolase [Solobacterium sp.]|nr:HAD-IIB family hydrolase [Solobacterium sp.]